MGYKLPIEKLGLNFCLNRPTKIYHIKKYCEPEEEKKEESKEEKKEEKVKSRESKSKNIFLLNNLFIEKRGEA